MESQSQSGIYCFTNIITNKKYIGSAKNIIKRQQRHLYMLRHNKHHSILFQRAFNKYGEENFKFETLEIVNDFTKIIEREQYYFDTILFSKNKYLFLKLSYNLCPTAYSTLGLIKTKEARDKMKMVKHAPHSNETRLKISKANKGKIRTQETKNKISQTIKNYAAIHGSPFKGKKFPEKSKKQVSNSLRQYYSKFESPNKGKVRTLLQIEAMKKVALRRSICIHCKYESSVSAISRWHNDNCKLKQK